VEPPRALAAMADGCGHAAVRRVAVARTAKARRRAELRKY